MGCREVTEGRRVFRNYYEGHMDKTKGEGGRKGRKGGLAGAGGSGGRKCRPL